MYITIEGPIGVGKTTLGVLLAEKLECTTLMEIVEENPFLSLMYEDKERWAFQTEMFFLTNRYGQLKKLQNDLKIEDIVSDYDISKNLIFSKNTLDNYDYQKFEKVYHALTADFPKSDLIIFLTASTKTLQKRINLRGREFEKNMDDDYLEYLIDAYDLHIKHLEKNGHNVLLFNCDDIDFVHNIDDQNKILNSIISKVNKIKGENNDK